MPVVVLNSVFFPTDYPEKENTSIGLMTSQQNKLTALKTGFDKYLEYDPDAKLSLMGYTDERGPEKYNQALSERRIQSVKDFLVGLGIPEEKISTMAYGETQQLDKSAVEQLQSTNPVQAPSANPVPAPSTNPDQAQSTNPDQAQSTNPDQAAGPDAKKQESSWLAYNRRVDIVLIPKNQESLRFYPNDAPEIDVLSQRPKPSRKAVENADQPNSADQPNNASPDSSQAVASGL
jgi:outer membrane protein OmpA-like peptidoglycan-associated protein